MNIFIGCLTVAAALYIKLKYRPEGELAKYLFGFTVLAGVVSMMTAECYDTVWLMLWPVFDVAVSALIFRTYFNVAVKQAEERKRKAAAEYRAAVEREKYKVEMAKKRSLESLYAIYGTESLAS